MTCDKDAPLKCVDVTAPQIDAGKQITSAGQRDRLADLPLNIDFGERVVGTSEVLHIQLPALGRGAGTATVVPLLLQQAWQSGDIVQQEHALTLMPQPSPVLTSMSGESVTVNFNPRSHGECRATLKLNVFRSDGGSEEHAIELRVSARQIWQAPVSDARSSPADVGSRQVASAASDSTNDDASEDLASNFVTGKLSLLTTAQTTGINHARTAAGDYTRAVPEDPWYISLALTAVSLGFSGVAAGVGEKLGHALLERIGRDPKQNAALAVGVADVIKGGLEQIADLVRESGNAEIDSPTGNFRLDFFKAQDSAVLDAADQTLNMLHSMKTQLAPAMKALGPQTIRDALAIAVAGTATRAAEMQERASAMQWIAAVAKEEQGTQLVVDRRGVAQTVTDMRRQPMKSLGMHGKDYHVDGTLVLQVLADRDDDSAAKITSAAITGVAGEIAVQLRSEPLLTGGVPVRLIVKGSQMFHQIDLDESGRIRVKKLDESFIDLDDPSVVVKARKLVERLLSVSLKDQQVHLATDDAS